MGFDEKYILAGIVIGGILFSIVQIFLLKFVEEYRKYAFVLPIVFCLVVIGFSILDTSTISSGETMGTKAIEYYSTDIDTNYQPAEFRLDWRETLVYWLPRLFFPLLPLVPMIIFRKRGKSK